MGVVEISMLLLKIPLLVILSLLQAILSVLDRLTGFFTGLITLVLTGFLVHHCMLGNRVLNCIRISSVEHLKGIFHRLVFALFSRKK